MPNVYPANPPNMDVRITKSAAEQLALDLSEEMNARIAADNVLRAEIDAIEVPEIPIGVAGFNEYLSVVDSTVSGYDTVGLTMDATETEVAISATNATVWGMKYLAESTLKTTTIPAGSWAFNYNRKVSSTMSETSMMIRAFVRHSNGTEDVLFTLTSPSIEETTYQPRVIDYSLAAFTIAATDRLGFQIGMVTTRVINTTVTYIVGNGRGFFIRSPLAIEHNNLLGRSENDAHPQSAITGLVTALAGKVSTSATETIAGVKTFSSSPLLPALAQTDSSTKAASSAFVHLADTPVSDISRILDVTGDGVPELPDDPAGTSFVRDGNFTSADIGDWTGTTGTINTVVNSIQSNVLQSVSGGIWQIASPTYGFGLIRLQIAPQSKVIRLSIKYPTTGTIRVNSDGTDYYASVVGNQWTMVNVYHDATGLGWIDIEPFVTAESIGTTQIRAWYIGTGAYLTKVADRSGNSLDLLNTAVTPVNTVNGRGLSFNGATSFLRTAGYFTQPDVMTFMCKWSGIENLAIEQMLFGAASVEHQQAFKASSSTTLTTAHWNGTLRVFTMFLGVFTSTTHTIAIEFNRTNGTIKVFRDGILLETKSGQVITLSTVQHVLYIGKRSDGYFLKGTLSNVQLHSRALTADEHYRYHIDPTSVDSSVPQIPTLPVFADNAAAITGNLQVGRQYRTSTGALYVVY